MYVLSAAFGDRRCPSGGSKGAPPGAPAPCSGPRRERNGVRQQITQLGISTVPGKHIGPTLLRSRPRLKAMHADANVGGGPDKVIGHNTAVRNRGRPGSPEFRARHCTSRTRSSFVHEIRVISICASAPELSCRGEASLLRIAGGCTRRRVGAPLAAWTGCPWCPVLSSIS